MTDAPVTIWVAEMTNGKLYEIPIPTTDDEGTILSDIENGGWQKTAQGAWVNPAFIRSFYRKGANS